MISHSDKLFEFGPFLLDISEKVLLRDGTAVFLPPKAFELLALLIQRNGRLVDKNELLKQLWPSSIVEENSLSHNIYLLRKTLGKDSHGEDYIQTIPRRGYRFVADVKVIAAVEEPTQLRAEQNIEDVTKNGEEEESEFKTDRAGALRLRNVFRLIRDEKKIYKRIVLTTLFLHLLSLVPIYLWVSREKELVKNQLSVGSVAVLPFKPLGEDSGNELLGLGMADAIIIKLSSLKQFTVLPTNSVFKYAGRDQDALAIGRALGVDAVLDGTVQRSGERIRVSVQLINSHDGTLIWSGSFDERYSNIFVAQDAVAAQVAGMLPHRTPSTIDHSRVKQLTDNTEAYHDYLMGLYFLNKGSKLDLMKAIQYFQEAIRKDPGFARAYGLLADSYVTSVIYGYDATPEESLRNGYATVKRALELDAAMAEAYTVLATIKAIKGDLVEAENDYKQALNLNPSYAIGHTRYGHFLFMSLRLNEAVNEMRRAQELDPVSSTTNASLGFILLFARDYDGALKYCKTASEIEPSITENLFLLGVAYVQKKKFEEAFSIVERIHQYDPVFAQMAFAYVNATVGRRTEALQTISKLQQAQDDKKMPLYNYALIYALLGEVDKAIKWLEKDQLNRMTIALLAYDPQLDVLRSDPKFARFIQTRGLEHIHRP